MVKTVAVVEDEATIRENYADALRRQGYQVRGYANRSEALQAFGSQLPDLVLLDISLEDEIDGGFDLCRELRARSSQLPIIFLTARDSDLDTISGLRLGADDYLTKNVSLAHLNARVAALFRRQEALLSPQVEDNALQVGSLNVDLNRLQVRWRTLAVDLTLTEFWLLHSLIRFPGHVKNREQLMREANVVVDDSTITSHIKRIRKKFLLVDTSFDSIETVYGMGYRWVTDGVEEP